MAGGVLLRELYLIRHGESYGNLDDYEPLTFKDKQDPLLTPQGLEQADKVGRYLADKNFAAVYSSGLRRAAVTAAGVAKYQQTSKSVNVTPLLCEIFIDPAYEGCDITELNSLAGGVEICFADGVTQGARLTIPDETPCENEQRYFARAKELLDYIDARYRNGEKVAVVSHAGFLTYIIFYLMGYRDAEPNYDFRMANTGITKISFYEPGTYKYGDMVFRYINRNNHL